MQTTSRLRRSSSACSSSCTSSATSWWPSGIGVRVLTFSLGFGPKLVGVQARRHRVLHQRHPARRLREDGRREPRRPAHRGHRRVPVRRPSGSGSRSSSWDRSMNLAAGRRPDGGRADAGRADVPPSRTSRRSSAPSRPGRRPSAAASAGRPDRQRRRPPHRHLGAVLHRGRHARASATSRSSCCARGASSTVQVDPRRRDEVRDRRHRRAARRAPAHPGRHRRRAGRPGGPQGGRRRPRRQRRDDGVLAGSCPSAIATRAGEPVVFTIERGGVRQDISVTPVKRGSRGVVGIGIGDEVKSIQPTPLQAVG